MSKKRPATNSLFNYFAKKTKTSVLDSEQVKNILQLDNSDAVSVVLDDTTSAQSAQASPHYDVAAPPAPAAPQAASRLHLPRPNADLHSPASPGYSSTITLSTPPTNPCAVATVSPQSTLVCSQIEPSTDSLQVQSKLFNNQDISTYLNLKLDNETKINILENLFQPELKFKFPSSGERNLKFQIKWMGEFDWLAYSKIEDGAYCKYCVLFAPDGAGSGGQTLGQFCKCKFDNWKKAKEKFSEHENTLYHKNSMESLQDVARILQEKQKAVNVQLNAEIEKNINEAKKRLFPVVNAILLCGRQGIALRGHRDSGQLSIEEPDVNDGNFRAIVRLQARVSDDINLLIQSAPRNAQYCSPLIQNDIIECINKLMLAKLVDMVNSAPYFTILGDETRATDGTETFVFCLRFYDQKEKKISEIFLQFETVYDVTGLGLANKIIECLKSYGIDIQKMRGQGYDGANAMKGDYNGVQTHIRNVVPTALYLHCVAHSLNLAISDACDITEIRNCMGTIESVYTFFNTPKRGAVLTAAILEACPEASYEKLKQLCATRWVERHDSVDAFSQLLDAIFLALENIVEWKDKKTSSSATQLLAAICKSGFLVSLFVLKKIFSYTIQLCKVLQSENIDLGVAVGYAEDVAGELKQLNYNAELEFRKIYQEVHEAAEKHNITLSRPRIAARQAHRSNVVVDTVEDYYRISIYQPLLSNFHNELHNRFLAHKTVLKSFMTLLPTKPENGPSESQIKDIKELKSFYHVDITCSEDNLVAELKLWYRHLSRIIESERPKCAIEAIDVCIEILYPNILKLLTILVTLPVSTAKPERSFSTLKYIKNYLRSTTGEKRLNGLALMYIYRNYIPSVDCVIHEFAKKKRRLSFT